MRPLRKNLLLTAGIINIIVAFLCLGGAFFLLKNLQWCQECFYNIWQTMGNKGWFSNIASNTTLNILIIYLFFCFLCNSVFGLVYMSYANYKVEKFYSSKSCLKAVVAINVFTNIILLSVVIAIVALVISFSENEKTELKSMANKNIESIILNEILNNAKYILMSMQIIDLKKTYSKNKITSREYHKSLNKIIENNL